ncbi:MAG: phosphoribosylglycinamide formyltransferase [Chitinophagaceae bacterium]|nr:phosphoribosylglycinamide formyltransferase [Chitinophagaceae bacterium]
MKTILLFASGAGSNVAAILRQLKGNPEYHFPLILTNNPKAGVIELAKQEGIDVMVFDRETFQSPVFIDTLDFYQPDLLVLAGFLWKIPEYLVKAYRNKIVNIHPALLPKFGGKGMYGHHVHEAVIAAGEKESGISIHLVNEHYDEGTLLLQKTVTIEPSDTPDTLAKKVLALEHEWYAKVIQNVLK